MPYSLRYAFQSSVYSEQIEVATSCVRGLEAAAVMVNDHSASG